MEPVPVTLVLMLLSVIGMGALRGPRLDSPGAPNAAEVILTRAADCAETENLLRGNAPHGQGAGS